jgi:lysophospholipase L1-like esterase
LEQRTIYLAGDSTMADYPPESYPMQGWGNKLHLCIPDSVRIVNKAVCGRSSKSFIEEGRLEEIVHMIKPGDLCINVIFECRWYIWFWRALTRKFGR